mmetsp:Transcript_54569/g.111359  ORF Transcript_54569/g.111359 Transcript_54569/m.111359 type:complete len:89 (+) Transcript_54569:26-292(+)|eukprot:CAMPEP_0181328184 /NCGR_PEP_ID=MMETSP1101-20121128/22552_1 /TAXON_ID=46948 /ORGANISM="Rhodomonas abbreviata, Strain Caron Lab Isolate" /LENGTH=88 /DNA_ID=CAMNT_0023436999 /DNA_START=22 /DNA_END=288 /DNA_ORIENTATION=-
MNTAAGVGDLDRKSVKEVQSFIEHQQQIQQIQAVVGKITELCWDKCVSKPGKDLTESEKNCVANCSERFLDTSMFVVNRIQNKQKGGK